MNGHCHTLGTALQRLFGEIVEQKNDEFHWIQRIREFSASSLVHLLVFGWIGRAKQCFAGLALQAHVSAQALQQRLTQPAVEVFQAILNEALQLVVEAHRPLIPLASRFPGIIVDDSTQLPLPDSLADAFPACGGLDGKRSKAAWKLLIRYDVLTGRLLPFDFWPGKTSDRSLTINPIAGLSQGMLYLADLGYFALERLRQVRKAGAHYVSRVPARLNVTGADGLAKLVGLWLKNRVGDRIDEPVRIGKKAEWATRLVALRVPETVATERRRKLKASSRKRDRTVSDNQLALCDWWVGITDMPASELSIDEVWTLYRLRWQIELLFKHWKQVGGLGSIHGRTATSVQVEYLAKLIGVVVTHWQTLLGGGPLEGKNRMTVHRLICEAYTKIARVLQSRGGIEALVTILSELAAQLAKVRPRPLRKKAPSARQLLYGKRVAA